MGLFDWGSPKRARSDKFTRLQDATKQAGADAAALGQQGKDFHREGMESALGHYKPATDQFNRLYGDGGELRQKGYLEQFYEQSAGGSNPYFDRLRDQGMARLAAQRAARGSFGGGSHMASEANFLADTAAQEYAQRAQLAAAAQRQQQDRLQGGFGMAMGLGGAQSGVTERGYGNMWDAWSSGEGARIQSNVDAARIGFERSREQENKDRALYGTLGSLGGTALGLALGGPLGGTLGGQLGHAVFGGGGGGSQPIDWSQYGQYGGSAAMDNPAGRDAQLPAGWGRSRDPRSLRDGGLANPFDEEYDPRRRGGRFL